MEKSRKEDSSPMVLATAEEIQKRLLRPTNSQFLSSSQHPSNVPSSSSRKLQKVGEEKSRKLEDYLDPILLSAVRVRIGRKRKMMIQGEENLKARYSIEFEKFEQLRRINEPEFGRIEATDLKNDSDSVGFGDEDRVFCSSFTQCERKAKVLIG